MGAGYWRISCETTGEYRWDSETSSDKAIPKHYTNRNWNVFSGTYFVLFMKWEKRESLTVENSMRMLLNRATLWRENSYLLTSLYQPRWPISQLEYCLPWSGRAERNEDEARQLWTLRRAYQFLWREGDREEIPLPRRWSSIWRRKCGSDGFTDKRRLAQV